jgi:pyruvate,water dikinase
MSLVPLKEALSEEEFGGKAVHLGAALRASLPVPPGFALSVGLVDRIAAGEPGAVA